MIEIGPVRGGDASRGYYRRPAEAKASTRRDLVVVSPVKPRDSARQMPRTRASAAFLAHLIATAEGLPQTREKRRLAPEEASRLYGAAQARVQPGRLRLRSL